MLSAHPIGFAAQLLDDMLAQSGQRLDKERRAMNGWESDVSDTSIQSNQNFDDGTKKLTRNHRQQAISRSSI